MLTKIYETTGTAIVFLVSMALVEYVFLIPVMKNRLYHHLYISLGTLVSVVVCLLLGEAPGILTVGTLIGLYIYFTGEPGRIRYIRPLKLFPILGITSGLLLPPIDIPVVALSMRTEMREAFSLTLYLTLLLSQFLVHMLCEPWCTSLRHEVSKRKLGTLERSLLYLVGSLMLLVTPTTSLNDTVELLTHPEFVNLRCLTSLVCFIVTLAVCILVMRSSGSAYLKEQVLQMQSNLIITMADIVENRDENTGGHIKRTAKYVEIIAVALKMDHLYTNILTDQYIADMIIAAPLHDIGKIHIPDAVLKKEGRFTDEEFRIMKSHTTAGKRLLLQAEKNMGYSSYLCVAIQMAGYHHEWWNGRGYPEGLKGQDIPLCARIMAVADVFDSLVSTRCYKGAMTIEQAYDLIARESGTHFDPVIVDAFLDVKDEIIAVAHEFSEKPISHTTAEEKPMAGDTSPIRPELDTNPQPPVNPAQKHLPELGALTPEE